MQRRALVVLGQLAGGVATLVLLAGCGGGSGDAEATATPSGSQDGVLVTLDEWSVVPAATTLAPGTVTLVASNAGVEAHELTVIRTELDAADLPTTAKNVLVDETDLDVVGTTPVFIGGDERTLTLDLVPGEYVLVCNLPTHYERGMYAALSVAE